MRAAFARTGVHLLIALLGILVAPPAVAEDIAMFELSHDVRIGESTLGPGSYVFLFPASSSYPGIVVVYDQRQTRALALAIVRREALEASEIREVGELLYGASIRSISHEYWRYTFSPVREPVLIARGPFSAATEIAMAR